MSESREGAGQDQPEEGQTPVHTQSMTSPTLDALLSPTEAHFSARESVASSAATDDDARFSTVALSSARQSMDSARLSVGSDDSPLDDRRRTIALRPAEAATPVLAPASHRKNASISTVLSGSNVPFMLAHLEDGEDGAASRRSSVEAQQKLQGDFADAREREKELESGGGGGAEEGEEDSVDWDFWGKVVSDYQKFASEHPEELASAIGRGIPKTIRGMIWQLMTASKDPELENTYLKLLKETSSHDKSITCDLGRTFPHNAFFTDGRGIGQENLFNVLKAYSLYDPQVGYCQGLPFVAAVLLLHMPDEEAFCLLVRLMYSYDLRGHFLPEMPKLQLRVFQFERLIEELAPVLHVHFLRQGVKSSMYCSQWFLTMFGYRFPMEIVFRIYDNCLASGIEALFSFSMALLLKNEVTLLELKFDRIVSFLNTEVFNVYKLDSAAPASETSTGTDTGNEREGEREAKYDVDAFVRDAFELNISSFMLDTYAQEYEEFVRTRDAQAIEMDALRTSNRNLSAQVKGLETSLAQLNTEHCELLNELVRARLKHEELESELVRYKLLYAEAMHQSEDAMSSHRISLMSKRGSSSTG